MALAAQGDVAELVRQARVEAVVGPAEQARKTLERALAGCEKAKQIHSDDCLYALIELSEHSKNPARYLDKAVAASSSGPAGAEALMRRGFLYVHEAKFDAAIAAFAESARRDPAQSARAAIWTAITHSRNAKHDDAARWVQNALRETKTGSDQEAIIANVAGIVYDQLGRTADAAAVRKRSAAIWSDIKKARSEAASVGLFKIPKEGAPGATRPSIGKRFQPHFGREARIAGFAGTVVVGMVITTSGSTDNVQVIHGLGMGLDEAAVDAVKQWRFNAATKDGKPVSMFGVAEVNYKLR